jgi:hypothetical protein
MWTMANSVLWQATIIGHSARNLGRSNKHEFDRRVEFEVRTCVAAKEQQSSPTVCHREVDQVTVIRGDRLHRDMQKLADPLVQILKA